MRRWSVGKPSVLIPNLLRRQFTVTRRTKHGSRISPTFGRGRAGSTLGVMDLSPARSSAGRPGRPFGASRPRRPADGRPPATSARNADILIRAPNSAATPGNGSAAAIVCGRDEPQGTARTMPSPSRSSAASRRNGSRTDLQESRTGVTRRCRLHTASTTAPAATVTSGRQPGAIRGGTETSLTRSPEAKLQLKHRLDRSKVSSEGSVAVDSADVVDPSADRREGQGALWNRPLTLLDGRPASWLPAPEGIHPGERVTPAPSLARYAAQAA